MKKMAWNCNLLTFDIEGFIEASHDSVAIPEQYISANEEAKEIEVNTFAILDLLAEHRQKATFFVLGRIARDMPHVVKRIANAGHEIGCHSLHHRRLHGFNRADVRHLLQEAKQYLEEASGKSVKGFRAPDFSIGQHNLWVFDELKEAGFLYDSSVYPTSIHDVYGIGDFPRLPFRLPNGLIEIPMSTVSFLGKNIPFGGGGYLRLYPLFLTRLFFKLANQENVPGIIYLHPFEIGEQVIKVREMPALRKFRTYVGINSVRKKLAWLCDECSLRAIEDFLQCATL